MYIGWLMSTTKMDFGQICGFTLAVWAISVKMSQIALIWIISIRTIRRAIILLTL